MPLTAPGTQRYPLVDIILIYRYSGWRINEPARMPIENIDLQARTFTGGLKNRCSRNRIVPIHSAIYEMVVTGKYQSNIQC